MCALDFPQRSVEAVGRGADFGAGRLLPFCSCPLLFIGEDAEGKTAHPSIVTLRCSVLLKLFQHLLRLATTAEEG